MDIKALEFYRNNSKCTENSSLVGKDIILYVDAQRIKGATSQSLTKKTIFPGIQNNGGGASEGSPFHITPLYFAGRASLVLDRTINSNNYKSWT